MCMGVDIQRDSSADELENGARKNGGFFHPLSGVYFDLTFTNFSVVTSTVLHSHEAWKKLRCCQSSGGMEKEGMENRLCSSC